MNEVKLTGESIPQMKESIASLSGVDYLQADKGVHKPHIVFGGTKLVMVTSPADKDIQTSPLPQDDDKPGAVLVYALRTGFETSQGKLMRIILFASDGPVTANSFEIFAFIGILVVFAIGASAYVLHEGMKDLERSRWKLMLSCTMIITSVIPPELPMELSLAVNNSLVALIRKGFSAPNHFGSPWRGKLMYVVSTRLAR